MKKKYIIVAIVVIVLLGFVITWFLLKSTNKTEIVPYPKYVMSISIAKKEKESERSRYLEIYDDGQKMKVNGATLDNFAYIVNSMLYYRVDQEMYIVPLENDYRRILDVMTNLKEVKDKKSDFIISLNNLNKILEALLFEVEIEEAPTVSVTYDSNTIKSINFAIKSKAKEIFKIVINFKELDKDYTIDTDYILGLDPKRPSPYKYVKSNDNPLEIIFSK